jgi:excisionase family DNA binding protein
MDQLALTDEIPRRSRRRARRTFVRRRPEDIDGAGALPMLLTVDDAADLLRTTSRAIYAMVERQQLPGIIRIRRRVLLRTADLLDWLDQKRAPSLKE